MKNIGALLKQWWRELVIILLIGAFGFLCILLNKEQKEMQNFYTGAEEGFFLTGNYYNPPTPTSQPGIYTNDVFSNVSFSHPDEKTGTITWQVIPQSKEPINGSVEATSDPNMYILHRDDGRPDGSVHIAYASSADTKNPESIGLIFLDLGDGELHAIKKQSKVPATQVDSHADVESTE